MSDDLYGSVEHYYKNYYSKLLGESAKGVIGRLWKYPHKVMERHFTQNDGLAILELGAGALEHLNFVRPGWNRYVATDLDLSRIGNTNLKREMLELVKVDAQKLPFSNSEFDRVIATCILAHLRDPEFAIQEWRRVTKNMGVISIYLPCEPGLGLRIFRRLISERAAKSLGFRGYQLYIARDHINDLTRLKKLIDYVFREDTITYRCRPFPFRTWYINLFYIVEITINKHSED